MKFSPKAVTPTQFLPGAAGFDLCSVEEVFLRPNSVNLMRTDIGFKIPPSYSGKIHAGSSYALKFTAVCGGVIDSDYRGPVSIIFLDFSGKFIQIKEWERFIPFAFEKISTPNLREVESFDNTRTRIGICAFGSTNSKNCN